MDRVLLLVLMLSTALWIEGVLDSAGSGSGDKSICDLEESCQSINYAITIHIELLLPLQCDTDRLRNHIQCDVYDALNEAFENKSSLVIPCTMLDGEMNCRAMVTVLDNLTVSENLTRQLYKQLVNKEVSLINYTSVHLVNNNTSSSSSDDLLGLEVWEAILILVAAVLAFIGFCITCGLLIYTCVRRKQQPTKKARPSSRKVSIQAVDLNHTNRSASPNDYEMDTFHPEKKKKESDQPQSEGLLTVQQLHDAITDLPKLHEEFESLPQFITMEQNNSTVGDNVNEPAFTIVENLQDNASTPHSQVKLSSKSSNHINANYIKGYDAMERCYIVLDGPLNNTADDFWQMVWEQKPAAIAMLQQKQESFIYWPDTSETLRKEFGLITVTVRRRITKPEYIVTTLRLLHAEENKEHVDVEHYWYTRWSAEHFPTDTSGVIAFLQEINEVRKSSEGPLVVHCSDGLGCSGVLVTIDMARHQLETNHAVDIASIVSNIRRDRGGMVVMKEQYVYIYQVLSDWIEELLKLKPTIDTEKTASTDHLVP